MGGVQIHPIALKMTNNPTNRQQWIFDLLKVEQLSFGDCFSKYYVKFSKSEVTFSKDWNNANERYKEYQSKANKAKEAASIAKEVEALESGLKTKTERVLDLQKQIIELKSKLDANQDFKYMVISGKVQKVVCEIDLQTRARLHSTILSIQGEISKIEGDYAPAQIDAKVKNIVSTDFTGLSLEQLKDIVKGE